MKIYKIKISVNVIAHKTLYIFLIKACTPCCKKDGKGIKWRHFIPNLRSGKYTLQYTMYIHNAHDFLTLIACVVLINGHDSRSSGSRYGVIGLSTISRATIWPSLRFMVGVQMQLLMLAGPTSTYTAAGVPKIPTEKKKISFTRREGNSVLVLRGISTSKCRTRAVASLILQWLCKLTEWKNSVR